MLDEKVASFSLRRRDLVAQRTQQVGAVDSVGIRPSAHALSVGPGDAMAFQTAFRCLSVCRRATLVATTATAGAMRDMSTYVSATDALQAAVARDIDTRPRSFALRGIESIGNLGVPDFSFDRSPAKAVKGATAHNGARRLGVALAGMALVAGACVGLRYTLLDAAIPAAPTTPIDGLTIFAVFFVAALSLERLLEPLSSALLPNAEKIKHAESAKEEAGEAMLELITKTRDIGSSVGPSREGRPEVGNPARSVIVEEKGQTAGNSKSAPEIDQASAIEAMKTWAETAEAVSVREMERTVSFWAIATCAGMVVAAAMKLYFLRTVGITAGKPWQEMLATGLILGAGTKPLHDLVAWISGKAAT